MVRISTSPRLSYREGIKAISSVYVLLLSEMVGHVLRLSRVRGRVRGLKLWLLEDTDTMTKDRQCQYGPAVHTRAW